MAASPPPIAMPMDAAAMTHRPTSAGGVLFPDGHTASIIDAPIKDATTMSAIAKNRISVS